MAPMFITILCFISSLIIGTNGYLTCSSNCHFKQSLDSPVVIADKCNKTEQTSLCQVDLEIDYNEKSVRVTFGSERFDDRKRSIDDKYDYVEETTTINKTQIKTKMFYSCTLENGCDEKFVVDMLPKLTKKDYTAMQQKFMDLLTAVDVPSITCEQRWGDKTVLCNGTCVGERNQFLELKTGQPVKTFDTPSCELRKMSPNVIIMATKTPMNNRSILTREIWYKCAKDYCNGLEITDRIEKIVNEDYRAFYQD